MARKLLVVDGRPFQADWNVTDENAMAYIRNKPNLPDIIRMKNITLDVSSWTDEGPYTQAVELDNITSNSKIDIQADADTIAAISAGNYRLLIKNDSCTVMVYAVGAKPSTDLNLQLTITEVAKEKAEDVVWGNVI